MSKYNLVYKNSKDEIIKKRVDTKKDKIPEDIKFIDISFENRWGEMIESWYDMELLEMFFEEEEELVKQGLNLTTLKAFLDEVTDYNEQFSDDLPNDMRP